MFRVALSLVWLHYRVIELNGGGRRAYRRIDDPARAKYNPQTCFYVRKSRSFARGGRQKKGKVISCLRRADERYNVFCYRSIPWISVRIVYRPFDFLPRCTTMRVSTAFDTVAFKYSQRYPHLLKRRPGRGNFNFAS